MGFRVILLIALTQCMPNFGAVPTLFGHNLTPTTYGLQRHEFTIGSYILGYGLTEHLSIATSPWFILGYNMPLISAKFSAGDEINRLSVDGIYFKSFHYGLDRYSQESFFGRLTGSHRFSKAYTLHASLGFQYFVDDSRPYSFRLVSGNGDAYNLSASVLNEVHLARWGGMMIEGGFLGLNYASAYLHLGLSAFCTWDWGMVQLGASRSVSLEDAEDWLVHPEVQFQLYF